MHKKPVATQTFDITIPKKLYRILFYQAQQKFRSVSEEICFLLTELLCGNTRTPRQSTVELFETLLTHSEQRAARKAKQREKVLAYQKEETAVISINRKNSRDETP